MSAVLSICRILNFFDIDFPAAQGAAYDQSYGKEDSKSLRSADIHFCDVFIGCLLVSANFEKYPIGVVREASPLCIPERRKVA